MKRFIAAAVASATLATTPLIAGGMTAGPTGDRARTAPVAVAVAQTASAPAVRAATRTLPAVSQNQTASDYGRRRRRRRHTTRHKVAVVGASAVAGGLVGKVLGGHTAIGAIAGGTAAAIHEHKH